MTLQFLSFFSSRETYTSYLCRLVVLAWFNLTVILMTSGVFLLLHK